MPHCVAKGCGNKSFAKSKAQLELEKGCKITFHRFPSNSGRRKVWLDCMELQAVSLPKYPYLCSCHFPSTAFDRTSLCNVRLKADATPTLQKNAGESVDKNTNEESTFQELLLPATTIQLHPSLTKDDIQPECSYISETRGETSSNVQGADEPASKKAKIIISADDSSNPGGTSCLSPPPIKSYTDRSTSVSPSRIFDSPVKTQLRNMMKAMKDLHQKQIRALRQKTRRKDKQIATLRNVLRGLKKHKYLIDEELDILKNIGMSNTQLLRRVVKKSRHGIVAKKFEPELRAFALTLHYYSPRAYNYVRQKFDSCLPHPKTLSKWYKSVSGEPGFNTEAFKSIEERVKIVDHLLVGSLVFDEMAIRQHIEYDGNKFSGYVDMGNDIATDTLTPARDALVFLFVCMNGSWKIPVGYFLTAGITASQKATLVKQCITMLHESGVRVISLIFDGASANISMAKQLNCQLNNPAHLQPWFLHPVTSEKVFVVLDPCHMLKLVRNTLGDSKCLINEKGDLIKWEYIEQLHRIQEEEGLHLGNKLRSGHVQYYKHKMKVKFATQVFSASVADALRLCRMNLQLDTFKYSEATEEFLTLFNDLFDIFNSKNLRQSNFKKPINLENSTEIIAKLNDCRAYILQLKDAKTGRNILETQRKTGFLGFLICIETLKGIFQELCEEKKLLTHIPGYKLSQDHIELFFGCIRGHGGHNNNPTARQFKAAFKKMLIHSEIRETDTGNCVPLETIAILHISSVTKPEDIINSSTPTARMIGSGNLASEWNQTANVLDDHSYLPDIRIISEFSDRIIVYIAGFVVRHLCKTLRCEVCVDALTGTDTDPRSALISLKNRGGLYYPSYSVISICRKAEKLVRFALRESGGKFMEKKFSEAYLVNCILANLTETTILFDNLNEHSHDQTTLENHSVHLTSAISRKYVQIRFFYIGKKCTDTASSDRHKLNKLTLFKGQ